MLCHCLSKHAQDPVPLISQGFCYGSIAMEPRGTHGFGYDSVFYVPSLHKTVAQLSTAEKNMCSHRAMAVKELMKQL